MRFVSLLTLSSPEGERARNSFNNPAARSEIYYFRATLLDKSIWLTVSLATLLAYPLPSNGHRRLCRFCPGSSFFSLSRLRNAGGPAGSRTSVQGDLIKRDAASRGTFPGRRGGILLAEHEHPARSWLAGEQSGGREKFKLVEPRRVLVEFRGFL